MSPNTEMAYIDLRVFFEVENEEFGNEVYVHYSPSHVAFKDSCNIDEEGLNSIGESAFQSDSYTVGLSNAVLSSLGGGSCAVRN